MERAERIIVLSVTAALIAGAMIRFNQTTAFVKQVGSIYLGALRTFSGTTTSTVRVSPIGSGR